LSNPVTRPYAGARQEQEGISARDIQELVDTEGLTLGQVMKTLSLLAHDVSELKGSIKWLAIILPSIVAFGIAVIAVIVKLK